VETPIGFLPGPADLDTTGLALAPNALADLLAVDAEEWRAEFTAVGAYLEEYGARIAPALRAELGAAVARLSPRS
jgi:phosphoenolpyruvate carboxykinase (GTP)